MRDVAQDMYCEMAGIHFAKSEVLTEKAVSGSNLSEEHLK